MDNRHNPKKLWNTIKDICEIPHKVNDSFSLLHSYASSREAINSCNLHFATVGSNLASQIFNKLSTDQDMLCAQTIPVSKCSNSFFMTPTDSCEISRIISDLKIDSSPGIDTLGPRLLKHVKDAILVPLTYLCNLSISTGTFPDSWKVALVSPIHKSGRKDTPDNYRPISLLCILSKILEKVVNKRLVDFLGKYNLLSDKQFGFRKGKSTSDAIGLLTDTVSAHLDNRKRCIGVFLDLQKAFDTVSVPLLIRKLESFGIRGSVLAWFNSYLFNRYQRVKIAGHISEELAIDFGVPQGSILAPTLFTHDDMDDILRMEIQNAELICYADDTVALFHGLNWQETIRASELGMSKISSWLDRNILTLNIKKTNFVAFHINRATFPNQLNHIKIHSTNCTNFNQTISCPCCAINRVDNVKYLGVVIDQNLNFKKHVSTLSKKVRKLIYLMKLLRRATNLETRHLVFISLCQSLLQYCIGVWGGACKSTLIELERAQRAVLKVMLGKPRRFSTVLLYEEARVLSVRKLFILQAALKVFKLKPQLDDRKRRQTPRLTLPKTRSVFARRHSWFLNRHVFNRVAKNCDLASCNYSKAKKIIKTWLLTLSYDSSEEITSIIM